MPRTNDGPFFLSPRDDPEFRRPMKQLDVPDDALWLSSTRRSFTEPQRLRAGGRGSTPPGTRQRAR